jgi:hypothetical protein
LQQPSAAGGPAKSREVSNIDQQIDNSSLHIGPITASPSADIGDREFGNAPAPIQGSIVTSSQQSLTAAGRFRCRRCQTEMMLERVSPGPIGFEHRLFECPSCDHVEISVIASGPCKFKAVGWLPGELRALN